MAIKSSNKELVNGLQQGTPLFTLEVLSLLGLHFVSGVNFDNTNLSGAEEKSICELPQPQLEKLILFAAGFTRDIRYAAKHDVLVKASDSLATTKKNILEKVEAFFDQNCNVGLRIHRGSGNGTTSKPFVWAALGDTKFIKLVGNSLKLSLTDGTEYDLEPNDRIQIFSSPTSVNRNDMEINQQKKKEMNMGGGVICKLSKYDATKNIFTLSFNFITNNGNPRNIGENNQKYPEIKISIDVKEENGKFVLAEPESRLNLDQSVKSKSMIRVLSKVAEKMIQEEAGALFKLFSTLLTIYPKLDFHALKGFYAIEEGESGILESSSMIFDIESAEQGQLWHSSINKASVKNPNHFLQLVYEKLSKGERELEPSERILLAQLAINGHSWPHPAVVSDEIKYQLENHLFNFENYMLEKLSNEDSELAISGASLETKAMVKSLSETQYKNNSAESLFGRLLWVAVGQSGFNKVSNGVYEYESGSNTVVILDQGDHQVGFLIQSGKLINLNEYLEKFKTKNRQERLVKLGRLITENFGLQIVKAMFNYVLD